MTGRFTSGAVLALLLCPGTAAAQRPDSLVSLTVELDRPEWVYAVGDTAEFTVRLQRAGSHVPGARVIVAVGPERIAPLSVDTFAGADAIRLRRTVAEPGFLRATASAVVDGVTYTGMATAAFDPERIGNFSELPPDFEAFWQRGIEEARKVPLAPVMTHLPERSTPEVDVYHVSFQNQRVGSRLYGMLSIPKGAGPFPAMLVVPGAGVRPYFPAVGTAKRGIIHLAIGIHGIPVDRDSLLYNELRATALQHYMTAQLEDRERYYYRRVIVGVVRAGDFLFSLPQFDGRNYVVRGGSQGGALAIMAAALDPRVRAINADHPALADPFAYLHGRPGGWPHVFADTAIRAKAEKVETARYYDVVNFARLVRVPAVFTWGFNDTVVPPRSMYAAYNVLTAPKQVRVHPPAGHTATPEQRRWAEEWLLRQVGIDR